MVAGPVWVTIHEDRGARFQAKSTLSRPKSFFRPAPACLKLVHVCGSGRSDSRPLRASGPGAHGWERQQEGARAGMRYAMR